MKRIVLFVDDEQTLLDGLKVALRKQPYAVLTATSGKEALEVIEEHDVDVVVTDENMPGMSGTELLEQIRKIRPRALGVMLTGHPTAQAMAKALSNETFYRYLAKPLGAVELASTVRGALTLKRLSENAASLLELVSAQRSALSAIRQSHPDLAPEVLLLPSADVDPVRLGPLNSQIEALLAEYE